MFKWVIGMLNRAHNLSRRFPVQHVTESRKYFWKQLVFARMAWSAKFDIRPLGPAGRIVYLERGGGIRALDRGDEPYNFP